DTVMTGTAQLQLNGAVVENAGIFDIQGDNNLTIFNGGNTFKNLGTFRKSGGTGTSSINSGMTLENTGKIEVLTGTVWIRGGGSSTGIFSGAANTTIRLASAFTFDSALSSQGAVSMEAGTIVFNAGYDVAGATTFGNAVTTFKLKPAQLHIQAITVGTLNFNFPEEMVFDTLSMSGGTWNSAGPVRVTHFTWTEGVLSGSGLFTVPAGGRLTISGAATPFLSEKTLRLEGDTVMTGTAQLQLNGAVVENAGTFDIQGDNNLTIFNGGNTFKNLGAFRKSGGAGVTTINGGMTLENTGKIEVLTGTVWIRGGGSSTGIFSGAANTTIRLASAFTFDSALSSQGAVSMEAGTIVFNAGYDVAGATTFGNAVTTFKLKPAQLHIQAITVGTLNFNFPEEMVFDTLSMSGGTWNSAGPVKVTNFTWTEGVLSGSGLFTVPAGGKLTISGGASPFLSEKTLRLEGDTVMIGTAQLQLDNGAVVENAGTYDIQGDNNLTIFNGGNTFKNLGAFRKSVGTGVTSINNGIEFDNTGKIEVLTGTVRIVDAFTQPSGQTLVNGGSLIFNRPVPILGGLLGGKGTITGNVTNSSVVSPGTSAGLLSITGKYFQTTKGSLHSELGGLIAGTDYDVLSVSDAATLDGNLTATLIGGFKPKQFDSFSVITFASHTGTFASINPPQPERYGWGVVYSATGVALIVTNTAPTFASTPATQSGPEGTALSLNFAAIDADVPVQKLRYALINPPSGANINPNTGAFTWTTTEVQGPSTNEVTVVVSDNATPPLSTTNKFQVIIQEVNQAPVLVLPSNPVVDENAPVNMSVSATDADLPANTMTFELVSGPPGLTLNPTTGVITWIPTEEQGPGKYTVTVKVTDNNPDAITDKSLSATGSFQVTVNEVNSPPVLTLPPNQIVDELATLTVKATAVDGDLPPNNAFVFGLMNGPAGLTVNASGEIKWTPTEAQGPGEYTVAVKVTDNGVPPASSEKSFKITVKEVNQAPVLGLPGNPVVDETTPVKLSVSATDADIPANQLTYEVVSGPPGLTLNPTTGAIAWTPTEEQGPGKYTVTVKVTDTNADAITDKSLSATGSFQVTVNEVNSAPTITGPADQTVDELAAFQIKATAQDGDAGSNNTIAFALVAGPPGLTVSSEGEIRWTPTEAQGPGVYTVALKATDNGVPPASAEKSFKITVKEVNQAPGLDAIPDQVAHSEGTFLYSVKGSDADEPANTLTYAIASGPAGATIDPATGRFSWAIPESQAGKTNAVTLKVSDGGTPELSSTVKFNIAATGALKITSFGLSETGVFAATWVTIPGHSYALEFKEDLNATTWVSVGDEIKASGVTASREDIGAGGKTSRLYRIRQVSP
ncbi:MAG: cadherin repeat domain-containing protein, partial [Pedosphaera sp.]|nr:cadherin repeat domain-containing protein [Pedosphaera sp.]